MRRAYRCIGQLTQQPAMDGALLVPVDRCISIHFQTGMRLVDADHPDTKQLRNSGWVTHATSRVRRKRPINLPPQVFQNSQLSAHMGAGTGKSYASADAITLQDQRCDLLARVE